MQSYKRGITVSILQLSHSKVAQPKSGAFRSQVCLSFRFIMWSAGTTKSTILQILFLLLIIMRSGLLAGIIIIIIIIIGSHLMFRLVVWFYSISTHFVRIRDVALKTYQRWWMIGRSGERGSGISVLAARHDDVDDFYKSICEKNIFWSFISRKYCYLHR